MRASLVLLIAAACNSKAPAPQKHETAAKDPWKLAADASVTFTPAEREAMSGLTGDVVVFKDKDDFGDYRAVQAAIEHTPCVVAALPMLVGWTRIAHAGSPRRIRIRGLEPTRVDEIRALDHHMVSGSLAAFAESTRTPILLGAELAKHLGVSVGDDVMLDGDPQSFYVTGTFHFQFPTFDDGLAIIPLPEAPKVVDEAAVAIGVWVQKMDQCSNVRDSIEDALGGDPYHVLDVNDLVSHPWSAIWDAL